MYVMQNNAIFCLPFHCPYTYWFWSINTDYQPSKQACKLKKVNFTDVKHLCVPLYNIFLSARLLKWKKSEMYDGTALGSHLKAVLVELWFSTGVLNLRSFRILLKQKSTKLIFETQNELLYLSAWQAAFV